MTLPQSARLGTVADIIRGVTFRPDDLITPAENTTVACFRTSNVQDEIDLSDVWYLPRSFARRPELLLHEGDILISTANSWNLVGKCAWVPRLPYDSVPGGFIAAIRANEDRVAPRYLFHWLRLPHTQASLRRCANKTTNISNLNIERCLSLNLPLPSLDEQRRIAAILDRADDLRRKRRFALEKTNTLREARYRDLALEPGADTWPRLPISDLAEVIRTGPFGSQLLHSEFVESGIAVLGIDNTQNNDFSWSQRRYISASKYRELTRYTVRPGDVLITIMGTCGRCAIVPETIPVAINTKHLCCIRLDSSKCLPDFLHAAFIYDRDVLAQLGVRERGAVMPGLNMQLIKETLLRVPPLAFQTRYADELKRIKKLEMLQNKHLEKLNSLFVSLQHHAFAGTLTSLRNEAMFASV